MNELIRELALEAGIASRKYSFGRYWEGNLTEEQIKFAELIVQKCVTIVALHGISNFENEDISWVCDKIVKDINEQFGVES